MSGHDVIERVARAIYPDFDDEPAWAAVRDARRRAARAAIAAFLAATREPTVAMQIAARDWSRKKYGTPIGNDAAEGCWRAMHDALARELWTDDLWIEP